jgi:endonuclease YncB( thermonuclease family)
VRRAIVPAPERGNEIRLFNSLDCTMNHFFLVFILIFAVVNNVNAKNCIQGKQCGNSCISRDKECHKGDDSSSSSSSRSSGSVSSSISSVLTTAKHCAEGIPCGNTCIPKDKLCRENSSNYLLSKPLGDGRLSSSSASNYSSHISSSENNTSSNSSAPARSSSYSVKPQTTYECNGVAVTESEFKKCNSAQQSDKKDDKEVAVEVGDEKKITNSPKATTAVAAEILDADIFQCAGKNQQKIKFYGIDAPEDGQSFYQEAKDVLKKIIYKKKITAKIYSKDSDGTDMAVVFANEKNVNELMVKSGYAWVRRDLCDESFCDNWVESEEEAKSQGKGLWSDPGRIPPWVWK